MYYFCSESGELAMSERIHSVSATVTYLRDCGCGMSKLRFGKPMVERYPRFWERAIMTAHCIRCLATCQHETITWKWSIFFRIDHIYN
jgi:hypothetical protein